MLYFTSVLGKPVVDSNGETIGEISDLAIATGELFPRVTSIAFQGPGRKRFMLSWRRFVSEFGADGVRLNASRDDLRFSFLQHDEVLLGQDLLDKQIVDTQGSKVVRVGDLKLTESQAGWRLVGADVGLRGLLRRLGLEKPMDLLTRLIGYRYPERLIAWSYMDLVEKDVPRVKLAVSHKRLHEMHPADIADILEQLEAEQRAKVFRYLDNAQAADTIAEAQDEIQADILESLGDERASDILEVMDPDEAADIIGDLPYEKAELLLRLMHINEAEQVRKLLGYRENSAGGIMTTDYVAFQENLTVAETIEELRRRAPEAETIYYIYVIDEQGVLKGVLSLRDLIVKAPETRIHELISPEVISVDVDTDQEEVADVIRKYDLLAAPVVDEHGVLHGIVTVDDVLDVMEEESAEDLAIAAGSGYSALTLAASPLLSLTQRSAWLGIWLIAGVIAGAILHAYQSLLQSAVALVFFIPLVLRLSDDVSTRAIGVTLQAMRVGEIGVRQMWRQVAYDVFGGLVVGVMAGAVTLGLAYAWELPLALGLVIAVALAVTSALISLLATLIPWVLTRLNVDPSTNLGPALTTLMGAVGLIIYLSLARLFHV